MYRSVTGEVTPSSELWHVLQQEVFDMQFSGKKVIDVNVLITIMDSGMLKWCDFSMSKVSVGLMSSTSYHPVEPTQNIES